MLPKHFYPDAGSAGSREADYLSSGSNPYSDPMSLQLIPQRTWMAFPSAGYHSLKSARLAVSFPLFSDARSFFTRKVDLVLGSGSRR